MLLQEPKIKQAVEELFRTVRESKTFCEYEKYQKLVDEQPELKEKIDNFRRRNYEIQQQYHGDELYEQIERFEEENAQFRAQPLVDKYLAAELAYIRLLQDLEKCTNDHMKLL